MCDDDGAGVAVSAIQVERTADSVPSRYVVPFLLSLSALMDEDVG